MEAAKRLHPRAHRHHARPNTKLGDSLPRHPDSNTFSSIPLQGSTLSHSQALAQKYQQHSYPHQKSQHHPHPHSQNPYHHYKSDELQSKHRPSPPGQSYQSNGPYSNFHSSDTSRTHATNFPEDRLIYPNNYRPGHVHPMNYQEIQQHPPPPLGTNPMDEYKNTLNVHHGMNGNYSLHAHYDIQDYHNYKNHQHDYKIPPPEYKNQDYGTYGKHPRHLNHKLNGRLANDSHQQFSDSEITMSKVVCDGAQTLDAAGRGFAPHHGLRARRTPSARVGGGGRPASLHTTPQHTTTNTVPHHYHHHLHHHHHPPQYHQSHHIQYLHHQHHQQHLQPLQQQKLTSSVPAIHVAQDSEGVDVRGLQGVSAGELLGKTHEELVLLLIQLRRHHSALQAARHHARLERDSQLFQIFLCKRFSRTVCLPTFLKNRLSSNVSLEPFIFQRFSRAVCLPMFLSKKVLRFSKHVFL
ncbi:hypothetical protein SK128_026241 [Halocaridina rubra]|uniref:Uncharacterized protein n=1 Tax=Halocaridina rubra TaxID=373956 RepID=A0AAN8X8V1_HALRR